jgi:tetratricopeptide (TPR) repeat protein
MRWLLALMIVGCGASALAQTGSSPSSAASPKDGLATALPTSKEREEAIWNYATNRLINQQNEWFQVGDYPACISILGIEAEKWPGDYEIWTNLGWMEENVQDWDAALATYVDYRKRNPKEPDNTLPEAQYYFMKKQYAKVPDLLEAAVKRKCHPNNYRLLAWSYEHMKKYTDAVRVWDIYLATGAKDPAAVRNRGRDAKRAASASSR